MATGLLITECHMLMGMLSTVTITMDMTNLVSLKAENGKREIGLIEECHLTLDGTQIIMIPMAQRIQLMEDLLKADMLKHLL